MKSERLSNLDTAPTDPQKRIKHLELLLLNIETETQEERTNMQRKIKQLELTVKKLKKKQSVLKNKLKNDENVPPPVSVQKIEEEYKQMLREKEEACALNMQQIEFLKRDYRELEERHSGFSLDYIKDTLKKLFCKLPIMSNDIEKIIEVVTKMLGFTVTEIIEMKNIRTDLSNSQKSFLAKIFS